MSSVPSTQEMAAKKAGQVLGMLTDEDRSWVLSWHEDCVAEAVKRRPVVDVANGAGNVLGVVVGAALLVFPGYYLYKHLNPTVPREEACPVCETCEVCAVPAQLDWRSTNWTGISATNSIKGQTCVRTGDATLCIDSHGLPEALPQSPAAP